MSLSNVVFGMNIIRLQLIYPEEKVKEPVLCMVCKNFDVWISFGSMLEVRAFRERKKRSLWVRGLVENCVVYGDRGYRGCEGVIVCDSREMRAKRQVVEGGISQI